MATATNKKSPDQFMHSYDGSPHFHNLIVGNCGISIHREKNQVTVTITEPQEFTGASVSNNIEAIATQVYFQHLPEWNPKKVKWRHHEIRDIGNQESVRDVEMEWSREHQRYVHPSWKSYQLIGDYRAKNVRLEDGHLILTLGDFYTGREVKIPLSRYPELKDAQGRYFEQEYGGTVLAFYSIPFKLSVRDAVLQHEAIAEGSDKIALLNPVKPTPPELA